MGNRIGFKITENRALVDPYNPEQSDYTVMYSTTITNAVKDVITGKALSDILKEQSEAIAEIKSAIADLRGEI